MLNSDKAPQVMLLFYERLAMKFFVSGSIRHKEDVRVLFRRIEADGHSIIHDWTQSDPISVKGENPAESGRRADADIEGAMYADVYVLDSSNTHVGKLMYGELVAAITAQKLTGTPRAIYIIGPLNHDSIVYYHPAVSRLESIEDVLEDVRSL